MQRCPLFAQCSSSVIVALLAVAAVESLAWAQLPADRQSDVASKGATPFGEEPPGDAENGGQDTDSPEEGTSDEQATSSTSGSLLERSKLTGDWCGWRSNLDESGIEFDLSTTQFYQGLTKGGLEQAFQSSGRNDYFLNLDGEKLGLWKGVRVNLHGETRYGESVNTLAGTLLAPNLLMSLPEPNGRVTALTGVTFTQALSEELLVYGGKFNTIDGVEQPLTGAGNLTGFQNTAMLYNPVFARTIPYSTFGAGLTYSPNEQSEFSLIAYDTNDTPTVSGFETFFNNGVTIYAESSLATAFYDLPGHQGLSGTYSTGKYTNLTPSAYLEPIEGLVVVTSLKRGSWSLAYNFDQALYISPDDPERLWGVFGNFGIADSNPSPIRWFTSAGVSGTSPFARRNADSFGLALFYLGVSDPLKNLAPLLLPLRDEYGLELYYNVAVTPWCKITPDLQVIRPFRERADTSMILGLRTTIDF